MADYFGAANDLLGGIGGFLSGMDAAAGDKAAAGMYAQAARYSALETGIKEVAANRALYQVTGAASAAIAQSGLKNSGSASEVMRSTAQQGAVTKALIALQGKIDYSSYMAMSKAAQAQADAASSGGWMSAIGGIVGTIGSLMSDDLLKTDVQLLYRREDGIGFYRFRYGGAGPVFEGVLASEVEKYVPAAVRYDDVGFRHINYDVVGMPFRTMERAA